MFDAIAPLTPGAGARQLTPDERAHVEDVLDAAADWQRGALPWQTAASIGGLELQGWPSPQYTRFAAVAFTPPGDPRRIALLDLIDVLIRMTGLELTTQGVFTRQELGEHEAAVRLVRQEEGRAA